MCIAEVSYSNFTDMYFQGLLIDSWIGATSCNVKDSIWLEHAESLITKQ